MMSLSDFAWMFSPTKIFANRDKVTGRQLVILVTLLQILILLAVGFRQLTAKNYDMENLVPSGLSALTEDTYKVLQAGQVVDGKFKGKSDLIQSGESVVAILPSATNHDFMVENHRYCLILTETEWQFVFPFGRKITVPLTGTQDLSMLKDYDSVRSYVNQQWFTANRFWLIIYFVLFQETLLVTASVLMVSGLGILLLRCAQTNGFVFKELTECLGLVVLCMFLPSVLITLFILLGLVTDPMFLSGIMMLGTGIMLTLVYGTTEFKYHNTDKYCSEIVPLESSWPQENAELCEESLVVDLAEFDSGEGQTNY